MAEEFRVLRPFEFHCQLMSKGMRADGRKLTEFRDIKLETEGITTANSSSLVKLGNTSLVCGCTTRLRPAGVRGQQDNSDINIKVELPPICSSPTGHKTQQTAQLLTKTLKNILDDTRCLDEFCLDVNEEDSYWSVDVEVICLNYDGCLLDAALIGVIAALKTLRLGDDAKVQKSFAVHSTPVCASFAIVGDYFICDPNLEEETVSQSVFSITVDPASRTGKYHINKVGGKAIKMERLAECVALARKRADHIGGYMKDVELKNDSSSMDCT